MGEAVSFDELRLELDELRASRARVVAAADAERLSIERDLHDGPQQHLVALAVNLQLARQLVDSDPDGARELLDAIGRDVREALENVRELAHRIYPPLLLDRGLAEALRAAAAAAGIPTTVEADAIDRCPPELEAAAYFCCLEALGNAARHGGPGVRATVRVWREPFVLRFDVADNGVGMAATKPHGAGLNGIGDRLAAIDGHLTVVTEPGRGTCVSGTVPLPR